MTSEREQEQEPLTVTTRASFTAFLDDVTSTERLPLVVVSIPEGAEQPTIAVDQVVEAIGHAARIYVLAPQATFWLTDELGKEYSVFSGWVRVYPARASWRANSREAPLLPSRANKRRWITAILHSVLDAAFADGFRPDAVPAAGGDRTTACVEGVSSATQVLVRTREGSQAILRTNHLWPGIAAERLVARGQCFDGVRVPVGMLDDFVPEQPVDDVAGRAVEFVGEGIVTSAKVVHVADDCAQLLLHPEFAVTVSEAGMRTVLGVDDVVTVEVIHFEGDFVASFSSEDPAPAMSVLPGGPPWLVPDAHALALDLVDFPADAGVADDAFADAALAADASEFEQEIERLQQRLDRERDEVRQLRRELRDQRRLTVPTVYADRRRQLDLELHLSYLIRVAESDRPQCRWPDSYMVSDEFFDTLDQLVAEGGIQRDKVVDVCAEVLCGLAQHTPARAVKEWRESKQGPAMRRADGAVAMRVRLQTGTHAARRLRYWKLPSGEIELDWVGVHDAELR